MTKQGFRDAFLSAVGVLLSLAACPSARAYALVHGGLVVGRSGSGVDLGKWTGGDGQRWVILPSPAAPGTVAIMAARDGKFLSVRGAKTTAPKVDLESPRLVRGKQAPEQLWKLTRLDDHTCGIVNMADTLALGVAGRAARPGTPLALGRPSRAPGQAFRLVTPPMPVVRTSLEDVTLTWAPVPDAAGYTVKRASAPAGPYNTLSSLGAEASTYTDTTATPGVTYYYLVTANGLPFGVVPSEPVPATPEMSDTDVPVDLSPWDNVMGLEPNGWAYTGPGFGNFGGYTYSAALVHGTVKWHGTLFTLGIPAALDCVSDAGQRIVLPTGNFARLALLGTYLGTSPTATGMFRATLTYTDGSRAVLTQTMTSWRGGARAPGEADAVTCAYRNTPGGGRQSVRCYVHAYQLALDPTKTVQWLDLPHTGQFRVLALTLNAGPSILAQGATLSAGQYLASPSGKCFLTMQTDGNLVLYAGSGPSSQGPLAWQSATAGNGGGYVYLQPDGNLLMHQGTPAAPGKSVWATATYGNPDTPLNAYLQVTDAGQVQVVFGGTVIWSNGASVAPPAQQP